VRYADDFVILHADRQVIEQCAEVARRWLKPLGLELKASKTRIAHTLERVEGIAGFDFLGFNIRQYEVGRNQSGKTSRGERLGFKTLIKPSPKAIGKHVQSLRKIIDSLKAAPQEQLIHALNRVIRGWARYHSTAVSQKIFDGLGNTVYLMLRAWAKRRHPNKGKGWCYRRYWSKNSAGQTVFQPPARQPQLYRHATTATRRHVKVQGNRSPYDGDWIYWSTRRGRSPEVSPRVAKLLRKQGGRCIECRLHFRDGDALNVVYINPGALRGKEAYYNLMLLHRYCQQQLEAELARPEGYV
jgi:RNA-directed DNA polymerase